MTDACKVEHNLGDEAFENIKSHAAGENKKRNFVRCDGRPTLRYAVVIVGPAWSLNSVSSEAQNRPPQPGKGRFLLPAFYCLRLQAQPMPRHNP